jgi:hypothetical protein
MIIIFLKKLNTKNGQDPQEKKGTLKKQPHQQNVENQNKLKELKPIFQR